jgi:hypothetical protein
VVRRYAGVDWAKEEHALCVLDEAGRPCSERKFAHNERGIASLCAASLVELEVGYVVAIERPEGLLVERLLEAGLTVLLAIHPNQLKAARPRFRTAGGKSDLFDAFVLAELARTDRHRFRALTPDSDATKAIKALTRAREDLVQTRAWRWPTAFAPSWRRSGREPPASSPTSTRPSRWPSSSATRAPRTPAASARSAFLRPSLPATDTAAAARRLRSCSSGCVRHPEGEQERLK